jgi:3,4-dihydroxy 2-butanone 4-phosphate synthase/GTP cyclohydrolase II
VSRLAGLNPSGVICEIMKDDGTMARLDDLIPFAQRHGLKIGTIRDLIAYRRRHDHLIERRAEANFVSRWGGDWKAITFFNRATQSEQLVLQKGHIDPDEPTLVRMHQINPFADIFGENSNRVDVLARSMEIIGKEGAGLIVAINRRGPDDFSRMLQARDASTPRDMDELRDYGVGAQILAELGVHDMILLTNTQHSLIALDGYGLSVVGQRAIDLQGD